MKTNFKSLALAALVLLGMGACSNELDEQLQQTEGQALTFNLSVSGMTRTATDSSSRLTIFTEGDAVGLFAYEKGTDNLAHTNVKLTFDGSRWTAATPIYSDKAYDFYAYYPYQEGVDTPTAISVSASANQTSELNYNASDVLSSLVSTVETDATEVALTFNHVFSLVEVQVSGDLVTAAPTGDITLDNVQTAATLNLKTGTATATGQAVSVKTQSLGKQNGIHAYRAIIPSQKLAAGTMLLTVNGVGDKSYAMKYSADVTYNAGKYRQLVMKINQAKTELTIPAPGINPWQPDQEIPGEGEEVTPPAPEPETLVTDFGLSDATVFTAKGKFTTSNYLSEGAGWFTRFADESADTKVSAIANPFTIQTTPAQTHAVQISLASSAKNGWNNNSVCYRIDKPFKQGKYKLTLLARATDNTTSTGGGVLIRTAGDDNAFAIPLTDGGQKTLQSFTITTEKEISVIFDFTAKTDKVNGTSVDATIATEEKDVKGISIYLLCNKPGGSIDVALVKLEEVAE